MMSRTVFTIMPFIEDNMGIFEAIGKDAKNLPHPNSGGEGELARFYSLERNYFANHSMLFS